MVVRQLLELVAAHPIAARVADVADAHPVAAEDDADERRPHAGAFGPGLRHLVDALVRRGDLLLEEERRVGEAGRDVHLGQLAVGPELRDHAAADDVDGDPAGDLAGVVPAHAVGEHRDAGVGVDEHRILVMGADHARVRQDGGVERDAFGHGLDRAWGPPVRDKPHQLVSVAGRRRCCERCAIPRTEIGAIAGEKCDAGRTCIAVHQCVAALPLRRISHMPTATTITTPTAGAM